MQMFLIGFVNFVLLQWFFVRLAVSDTGYSFFLLKWIYPLTGWFGTKYYPRMYEMIPL